MAKQRVVIVGAGPAGLTAAYELLRQGDAYEIVVLEETDRIGGISQTVRHGRNRMDIGGHRFFSKDERVVKWWADLMPTQGAPALDDKLLQREKPLSPGGPDPQTTDRVMLVRDRVSRIYYGGKFFDYPISLKPETIRNMGFGTTMKAGFSYLRYAIFKRPENSLEDFYINRFGKVLYAMFFEGYTEKLWGRHPRDISPDWGAQRVKGLSILAVLKDVVTRILPVKRREVETSLIEQFHYPKFGPGQLWEIVADEVKARGGQVRLGCGVTGVEVKDGRVAAVVYTQDGAEKRLEADIVMSTMPLRDLAMGLSGEVPAEVRRVAEGLPYRDFVTVGVLADRLRLQNNTDRKTLGGLVPDCWIYVQDPGVKMGRIQIFNNWSPYMVENPENTVWIGTEYFCDEGDAFWNKSDAELAAQAIEELAAMGVLDPGSVRDTHAERIKKAYPAYFDTYGRVGEVIRYVDGLQNLYCLGRNGQHRYNNMDHSMATAFEAVENIRTGRQDKANIWSVNTDTSYHETKET